MENLYPKIVSQNIQKHRKAAGLSQFTLATKAGIDPKTLYAIEHATCNVELDTLEKIANALCIPVAFLFDGIEIPPSKLDALIDLLSQNYK